MHGWLNACMSLNILTFLQYLHDFVFHINPQSYMFQGITSWEMGTFMSGVNPAKYEKPSLSLKRPYPLTRVKRRDFWSFSSDFPGTHTNPIWKQCLGETWCCFKPHQQLLCTFKTAISQHQVNSEQCCASDVRRLSMLRIGLTSWGKATVIV